VLSVVGSVAFAAIGSSGIANNSIRSIDVRNGSLTGADLHAGSVGVVDLAPAASTKAWASGRTTSIPLGNGEADVLARTLPHGSYTFVATAVFVNGNGQLDNPYCALQTGPDVDDLVANDSTTTPPGMANELTVIGAAPFAKTTTLHLACGADAGVTLYKAKLIATRVATLDRTGFFASLNP
jgi:hypothetical protein